MRERETNMPWRVAAIVVGLALVEPLTHAWYLYAPPGGYAPTGLTTGDSGHHLVCMNAIASGFHSPFATCESTYGADSFRYFAPALFLLYAIIGDAGHLLHVNPSLWLGIANGACGALYLVMVWRFLLRAVPALAARAFYVFTLGGGLGGVAYFVSLLMGWTASPNFERNFQRFAWYELIEGQHLSPLLLFPRLYYTLPLAFGFAALAMLIDALQETTVEPPRVALKAVRAALLLGICAFFNVRLGPLFALIALAYLTLGTAASRRARVIVGLISVFGAGVGAVCGAAMIALSPAYAQNAASLTSEAIRLLPFLTQTLWLWPPALLAVWGTRPNAPRVLRLAIGVSLVYLFLYTGFYVGHEAYYGNWLYGGESRATAIHVSDMAALICIAITAAWFFGVRRLACALFSKRSCNAKNIPELSLHAPKYPLWCALWLLVFTVAGLSGWGGGAWLMLSPQRAMVLLGLPLAIAAASGMEAGSAENAPGRGPRTLARTWLGLILICGAASVAVGALFFQGPLGGPPGAGPFAYLRYGLMAPEDARLMAQLPPGTVLVPGWSPIAFGEILAQNPGTQVLGGPGAMNLGDQPLTVIQQDIDRFFTPGEREDTRRKILQRWCVSWVYCPATCPIAPKVRAELLNFPALEAFQAKGPGLLFRVRR